MIIDMVRVNKVQTTVMQVIKMVAMLDPGMQLVTGCVCMVFVVDMFHDFFCDRKVRGNGDDMFINVISVLIVQMAVVKVINMTIMADRDMTIASLVNLRMVRMDDFMRKRRCGNDQTGQN